MLRSPLPGIARQPLHLFLLLDCSGSMAADGKIQALNVAVREALPHLNDVNETNPHAQLLLRAITFSTGARWHVQEPTPVDEVEWVSTTAGGYTDLGSAIELLLPELTTPPMAPNALPPAIVLVSDGMPTDDFDASLEALLATEWGRDSLRAGVAIGRDADRETIRRFMSDGGQPIAASNPEQLAGALRWATTRATMLASTLAEGLDLDLPPTPKLAGDDVTDLVW